MIKLISNYNKEDVDIQKLYGESAVLTKEEFLQKNDINLDGLSSSEATNKIHNLGFNEMKKSKQKKWYHYFLESLLTPFNSILLGIVAILIYTDIYLPPSPSYANIIVIAILVSASTLLDFFEEYRSNQAAEKLKELVATTTSVLRDGKEIQLPIKEITLRRHYSPFRW